METEMSCTSGSAFTKNNENMAAEEVLKDLGYEVLGDLGSGAFSMVKLAKSEKHPNNVAIKIIDRRGKLPNCVKIRPPLEVAILKEVKHPHVIKVHDIHCMDDGLVFIVMEAAESNLAQKLKEFSPFPPDMARTVFSQLVRIVSYLHKSNLAHRDLKCDNVLLTADGQVRLADFGFACYFDDRSDLLSSFCCTPSYAAPELVLGKFYDPKKSDVWSLGVILYMMVTGHFPFEGKSGAELLYCYSNTVTFPQETSIDSSCQSLISSMLSYSPSYRLSAKQVEQHPWLQSRPEEEKAEKTA